MHQEAQWDCQPIAVIVMQGVPRLACHEAFHLYEAMQIATAMGLFCHIPAGEDGRYEWRPDINLVLLTKLALGLSWTPVQH